jgi:oligopeptidase B
MAEVASAAWGADSRSLYYVTMDEAKRAHRLWRHVVGSIDADTLLFEEGDELFDLSVARTRDERWLLVTSSSMDTAEVRVADAAATPDRFALRVVFPRRADIDYSVEHRDGRFYVLINDTGRNYRLVRVDAAAPDLASAEELIAPRERVMLDDIDVFARHLVVTERVEGLLQLRVIDLVGGGEHTVAFDEPAYSVHASGNAEFETTTLRFVYTSLTMPASTWDYDLLTRERVLRKRQPVPGYDPALYTSERLTARAGDGTEVPISLVWRRDRKQPGPQPLLLYGYGSYGIPLDPSFAQTRVSLLDRGVVFAIAHIRGGGDLGRTWYEAAKMATKAVTFSDFIACADALVECG